MLLISGHQLFYKNRINKKEKSKTTKPKSSSLCNDTIGKNTGKTKQNPQQKLSTNDTIVEYLKLNLITTAIGCYLLNNLCGVNINAEINKKVKNVFFLMSFLYLLI